MEEIPSKRKVSRMYILAFGPLPSASQNDDASTGLEPGLKLTKMRVSTFWTAPYRHTLVYNLNQMTG